MNASLLPSLAIASLAFAAGAHAAPEGDAATAATRITRSAEGPAGDHAADELREPRSFTTTERNADDITTKPRTRTAKSIQSTASAGHSWIYDASTALFVDEDLDGYYRYLRVRFDADTIYSERYVYAEIYISADGNAWEQLYATADFAIWGSDPDDDYEVEIELVEGYSTALYDVLVELYDADTGEFLDEFGPNESPDFSVLPLEDSVRDGALPPPQLPSPLAPLGDGGSGAVSWLTLPGLLGALLWRRRRR